MGFLLFLFRRFGQYGLFSWIAFATVFANIEILKTVSFFGLQTTLGNALFGTVFLATDILSEMYGKETSKKAVYIGFAITVAFMVMSQIDLLFVPSETDFAQPGFEILFKMTPRVCLGSICAYFAGNMVDVFLYDKFKNIHGGRLMWMRNNVCTLVSQLFDNFILHTIAFLGPLSFRQIAILSVNVWLIEAVVALLDTPFLYLAKHKFSEKF